MGTCPGCLIETLLVCREITWEMYCSKRCKKRVVYARMMGITTTCECGRSKFAAKEECYLCAEKTRRWQSSGHKW